MDPELFAQIFGSTLFGPQTAAAIPAIPAAPTVAAPPVGPTEGPPAPFPPVQSFEPTNITSGFGTPKPVEPYMTEAMASTPLGASLEPAAPSGGVPVPTPRPPGAPTGTPAGQSNALLNSLKGVQMPAAPVAQKVSTPHAPALRPVQGGGLLELLNALNIGAQGVPGLKLPSTLGQALGGR